MDAHILYLTNSDSSFSNYPFKKKLIKHLLNLR